MDTVCVIELDGSLIAFRSINETSSDAKYITIGAPLDRLDQHAGIHEERIIISQILHELHATALVSNGQLGGAFIDILVAEALPIRVVPLDSGQGHVLVSHASQTVDFHWVLEVAHVVVHVHGTFGRAEQNSARVGGPFDEFEVDFELFAPETGALDRADDDSTVFVDDTDFFAIRGPTHVGNDRLVTVVDHFFEPVLFVHHPHYNQALLIGSGKFLILVIPLNDDDITLVALQVLVHGEVAATLAFTAFKLEHFEEAHVATRGEVTLFLVPTNNVQHCVVGH